jgi:type II secretory pathway component PulK
MIIRVRHRDDGIALILALIAVFVFSALAAGLALSMKVEARLAQHADSEAQMYWLGRSGVELARWVLSQQTTIASEPYDALNQVWAGGPGGMGTSNSPLCGLSLDNYPVGEGTVSVKIVDLDRKVNINTAPRDVIVQALTLMGVDANDISVVADSILDWIDANDDALVAGAESDYYQGLPMPYYAKNAPIDDLSELLLIKGVTPEMYWGGSATNHTPSVFQHKLGLGTAPGQTPDYPFGLKDIFTPVSSGRLNINTADANVLQIIQGMDPAMAESIIKQRAGPDGVDGTEDDIPYRNISQLNGLGLTPQFVSQINALCAVRSTVFEVHVQAQIGDHHREYIALLWRSSGLDIRVLNFYWQ